MLPLLVPLLAAITAKEFVKAVKNHVVAGGEDVASAPVQHPPSVQSSSPTLPPHS